MDPITAPMVAAALAGIFGGASGEAGRQAWAALTGLTRRTLGRQDRSLVTNAVAEVDRQPNDPDKIDKLAGALATAAGHDPGFATDLRRWLDDAGQADGHVTNVIGGSAQVHGNVVQARDIHGSITFGDPNPR
jgi:hypothetical protein